MWWDVEASSHVRTYDGNNFFILGIKPRILPSYTILNITLPCSQCISHVSGLRKHSLMQVTASGFKNGMCFFKKFLKVLAEWSVKSGSLFLPWNKTLKKGITSFYLTIPRKKVWIASLLYLSILRGKNSVCISEFLLYLAIQNCEMKKIAIASYKVGIVTFKLSITREKKSHLPFFLILWRLTNIWGMVHPKMYVVIVMTLSLYKRGY